MKGLQHIFYLGSETVCPEKDRQTVFYSPLYQNRCHLVGGKYRYGWIGRPCIESLKDALIILVTLSKIAIA